MKIEYVTGNAGKFEEAQHVLKGWTLEQVPLDLMEIQGGRHEIIRAKAKEALRILNRPLVVEDVSICCSALKGLPGPYIKTFLQVLGPEGIADLIHRYDDHRTEAICTVAFIKPNEEPVCFDGSTEGTIVKPRGSTKHGAVSWNSIFLPKGSNKTFGELSMEELSRISMRKTALEKLTHYLEAHEQRLHS